MSRLRGVLLLSSGALLWVAALASLGAPPSAAGSGPAAHGPGPTISPVMEFRGDEAGPYASRTRRADGRWLLPRGDAVLIDEAWWTPLRPLDRLVVEPPHVDAATRALVRARVAPGADGARFDRLTAVTLGDVTADGETDLVVSFRRPFQRTSINLTRPRRAWVDADGLSAHLGLYRPDDVERIWVAGTLVAPVVAMAACDGALAVAYGGFDGPAIVETGAWHWVVFGFLPTEPLPGPGTPVCVDIDGDGRTEPAIIERSER